MNTGSVNKKVTRSSGSTTDGAVVFLVVVYCGGAQRAEARVAARNKCNASIAWCC